MPDDDDALRALALVGYGHFTTVRVERGGVRGLDRHLARLSADCRAVFDTELDADAVRAAIREATAGEADVLARVTIVDPALSAAHPGADAHPRILVTTRPVQQPAAPVRLRATAYARPIPELKHTALFGSVRERRLAQRAGFDDAVFLDTDGCFSEGPTFSIGFVEGGRIVWPLAEALPSVTVALIDSVWRAGTEVRAVSPADLAGFAAAFTAGSGAGVRPVASIDDAAFDPGHPAIAAVQRALAAVPADRV